MELCKEFYGQQRTAKEHLENWLRTLLFHGMFKNSKEDGKTLRKMLRNALKDYHGNL